MTLVCCKNIKKKERDGRKKIKKTFFTMLADQSSYGGFPPFLSLFLCLIYSKANIYRDN